MRGSKPEFVKRLLEARKGAQVRIVATVGTAAWRHGASPWLGTSNSSFQVTADWLRMSMALAVRPTLRAAGV